MKLTSDDFEAWRHSPLTELIFDKLLQFEMDVTKAQHDVEAWDGVLGDVRHTAFRERYDTLEWLKTLSFEDLHKWLTEDQETQ